MRQNFLCNICGAENQGDVATFTRESGFCRNCKSTVRMRSAMLGLSLGLFGKAYCIASFPREQVLTGIGLSDWDGYAKRLRKVLRYKNTFFDRKPRLDVTNVDECAAYDFVISIDVFEHVPPPVARAFQGAANRLRTGGVLVFSAPYDLGERTVEHYPDLHEFTICQLLGETCVVNRKKDGTLEIFGKPVFHGGKGQTIEMRRFCFQDVSRHLKDAGFDSFQVIGDEPEFGVVYGNDCSRTIVAMKADPVSLISSPMPENKGGGSAWKND